MAQQTPTEARTAVKAPEDENSSMLVALANSDWNQHDAVQRGAPIADHPAADDSVLVEGTVACVYSSEKYMVETENGHRLVVTPENVRDFDTSERLGRPVYQVEDQPEQFTGGEETTELGADVADLVGGL